MITLYLDGIKDALSSYEWIQFVETIRCDLEENDQKRILLYRFRVYLSDGGRLEIVERLVESKKDGSIYPTKYSFHWQDQHGHLIKRWDNAPHYPNLDGFPHHIHIGEDEAVVPGTSINAMEMLGEVDRELSNVVEKG
ncbi:MAG: hypothetical protein KAU38_15825 [Desulfobacterales bacterium]|nr:hypothetical protein [Desulfobacterales bacterium]